MGSLHAPIGSDQPATVLRLSEQSCKARGRVEARNAEPVDRPIAADQRRGARVADQGVVLYALSTSLDQAVPLIVRIRARLFCVDNLPRCAGTPRDSMPAPQ